MIKSKMNGSDVIVTRTLTLPKAGALAEKELSETYTIKTGLSAKDLKTPVGKSIVKALPKVIDNSMNATRAKFDNRNIKIWKDTGGALLEHGVSKDDAKKIAKTADTQIAANWNEYSKKVEREVVSTVESLAASEAKKANEAVPDLKVKLSAKELKPERVSILTSLLAAVTFSVVASPLGWVVAGITGVSSLAKGYRSAWKIAQRQATDIQGTLNQLSDGLSDAKSSMDKLAAYRKQLANAEKKNAATIINLRGELGKMQGELEKLEKRAKSDKAVREGAYLKELRDATQLQEFKLAAFGKTLEAQQDLEKSIKAAADAVDAAAGKVEARRKGWDALMSDYRKTEKDSDTLMSSVATMLKQIGK